MAFTAAAAAANITAGPKTIISSQKPTIIPNLPRNVTQNSRRLHAISAAIPKTSLSTPTATITESPAEARPRFGPAEPRKGADILVEALERAGVTDVFAYPGGASMEIHQALTRSDIITNHLLRHEQGESFAAEGYARSTGKAGVCIATSGPGATNLVSALADALLDSTPLVAITGQVPRRMIGTDAFQETPIVEVTRSITKHNYLVLDVEDIPRIVKEAFFLATSGRPGPVLVDIPKDIQQQLNVPQWDAPMRLPGYLSRLPKPPARNLIEQIVRLISEAKRPVLYVGGGCSAAGDELRRFVELTGIPVASTLMGLGCYPTDDTLSLKMLGMHGTVYANYAVDRSDLLLAFGVRFDDRVTGKLEAFASRAKIVHIDIDPAEIGKNKQPHVSICADIKPSLLELTTILLKCISLLLLVALAAGIQSEDGAVSKKSWSQEIIMTNETSTMAQRAYRMAVEAAVDDPELVASTVQMGINNSTQRRALGYLSCGTGNPIDDCWRCVPNWRRNRKRLADCGIGFGRNALGGRYGRHYIVTDPNDDDPVNPRPGTLRHAVIQDDPLWIEFKRDMVITLKQELIMNSFKTIDGRGVNVHIAYGACLTIQFVTNIIIHGIHIHHCKPTGNAMVRSSPSHYGWRTMADGDAVSIFGSSHVWVDHCSLSSCADGLIDAIMGSTAITISNNYFTHHNEVMLLGHTDSYHRDKIMQVTIAFNHFGEGLIQRMPRCRHGNFHVVNNDYTHWEMYAIGGSADPTINSQGNRYLAPADPFAKEVTKRVLTYQGMWKRWNWRSVGDLMLNGAFFTQSGVAAGASYARASSLAAKPSSLVGLLTSAAGVLPCRRGNRC